MKMIDRRVVWQRRSHNNAIYVALIVIAVSQFPNYSHQLSICEVTHLALFCCNFGLEIESVLGKFEKTIYKDI